MSLTSSRARWFVMLLIVLAAVLVGGFAGSWATARTGWSPFRTSVNSSMFMRTVEAANTANDVSFLNGFVPVVKQVLPGVVNIASSKLVKSPHEELPPFFADPFFRHFFGDQFPGQSPVPREQRERSLGSGVIVSSDGQIITNNHVISGATEITVSLSDRREFTGKLVGADPKTDIAILKIDAKDLPAVALGDSTHMRVGDFAVAVGNPFGVGQTVTMGIISATGRGGLGIEDYEDFIQTDAAINPGNSGGALVDVNGNLVGINTAILSGGGGNQGVGFAVPINMARYVMDQILKNGKVIRGWLGVTVQPVTPAMAKALGQPGVAAGALVSDVAPDSPAARSGVTRGDIIVELNGQPVMDSRALSLKVAELAPGTTVRLKVRREGQDKELSVKLGELPASAAANEPASGETETPHLGISVETLTPQIAQQLKLPAGAKGVVIDDVVAGSAAEQAGLQRGDVIEEANRKPVTSVQDFRAALNSSGKQPVLLLVNRAGNHRYVVVEPE